MDKINLIFLLITQDNNTHWWNVKIQPAVNPRRLNALLFWIYLKMAPSCWQPSNGVSPTFTRRFNNYGLLCGLIYVSTHVCICIHSFKIFLCSESYRYIIICRNCRECHVASIYVLCKLFVFIKLSSHSNQTILVRKREFQVSREHALRRRRIDRQHQICIALVFYVYVLVYISTLLLGNLLIENIFSDSSTLNYFQLVSNPFT